MQKMLGLIAAEALPALTEYLLREMTNWPARVRSSGRWLPTRRMWCLRSCSSEPHSLCSASSKPLVSPPRLWGSNGWASSEHALQCRETFIPRCLVALE